MILIADSGSTKTDWVLLDENNSFRYKTIGYNPYFLDAENIYYSVSQKLVPHFDAEAVKKVFFYGAGCMDPARTTIVNQALLRCFGNANIFVGHDMLAAARALLGNKPGFAAILGTGSNTCIYDGNKIVQNIDSLGYILGDEGSGSYIGRKLLRDYMRGYMNAELHDAFRNQCGYEPDEIFQKLYNEALPNKFLASFCLFAHEHNNDQYVRKIVEESFDDFFRNLVTRYEDYQKYSFNCIGSVAHIFRDILKQAADRYGMQCARILHSPIEDLVNYHLTNNNADK